ncbi:MAG: 3-deoxy-8-phosphooctulonate synthase [Nitrospinota bacterium]|nr:3-deoxy-8-phosphooctulonate synthase [Nitrospinota bacterium]
MAQQKTVKVGELSIANNLPFTLIAGPCVIEDEKGALSAAEKLKKMTDELKIGFIYKSSYDKGNRSSIESFRGLGMKRGLTILQKVKQKFGIPVLSDIHNEMEIPQAAEVLDIIQIPAYLCRQTDILIAAAKTGRVINVKKGQFLAPGDMGNVVDKVVKSGNDRVLITERGTTFGYNNLVSDFRALPIMAETGYPVIFDATHSVQLPGGQGTSSGGERRFVAPLARAALAVGAAGVFMEVHPDPDNAPCDGPNMLKLKDMPRLLADLLAIDTIAKKK